MIFAYHMHLNVQSTMSLFVVSQIECVYTYMSNMNWYLFSWILN